MKPNNDKAAEFYFESGCKWVLYLPMAEHIENALDDDKVLMVRMPPNCDNVMPPREIVAGFERLYGRDASYSGLRYGQDGTVFVDMKWEI